MFSGKTVALFGGPGAFVSTSSKQHLLGYVANAGSFGSNDVENIICLSVDEPFVMDVWGAGLQVGDKVSMVADGNTKFAKELGMDFNSSTPPLFITGENEG